MKIISLPRGRGKTTELIKMSAQTKLPILCITRQQARYIKEGAEKLGIEIPDPITPLDPKPSEQVLIDDLDVFLQTYAGLRVYGATVNSTEEMSYHHLCMLAGLTPDDIELTDISGMRTKK